MTPAAVLAGEARWCVVESRWQDVLPGLPAGSVGVCLCDPPYSPRTHAKSRAGARGSSGAPLRDGNGRLSKAAFSRAVDFGFDAITQEEREAFADQCARLVQRWTLVFSDVESSSDWRGALVSAGLDYARTGAWVKEGCTPQFTGDRPAAAFEAITIVHQPGRKRWNGGGARGVWTHAIATERGGSAGVLSGASESRVHPTQKPLPLMLELVELFTDPGDVVLDAFAGSSTCGVACLRLGRRFIGIEMQAQHVATSRERLAAEERGSTLAAARAGQTTIFDRLGGT